MVRKGRGMGGRKMNSDCQVEILQVRRSSSLSWEGVLLAHEI